MAKKNRYRWQNEKKRARYEAWVEREKKHRSRPLSKIDPSWGLMLEMYELVSLHPLEYRRVPHNDETAWDH